MKALAVLALLAASASAGLSAPWPLLLLAVVALAVRAVEGVRRIYAWAGPRRTVSAATPAPPAYPGEQVLATVQLRRGRLVWVRRRA